MPFILFRQPSLKALIYELGILGTLFLSYNIWKKCRPISQRKLKRLEKSSCNRLIEQRSEYNLLLSEINHSAEKSYEKELFTGK
jgi:hypothetical protein